MAEIFALKGRDGDRPLILFVADLAGAERYTGTLPERVRALLARCWPGALTAVLPLEPEAGLPEGVGRAGTVGVRIPDHPVPLGLLRELGTALATTSANASGSAPVRSAEEAEKDWPGKVRALPGESGSVPSTVADFTVWPPRVLREGTIAADALLRMAREAERG